MKKLTTITLARVVKQQNSDWYIVWYAQDKISQSKIRYRKKFGLNRIQDIEERQKWANIYIKTINRAFEKGHYLNPDEVEEHVKKFIDFNFHVECYIKTRKDTLSYNSLKSIKVHCNKYNEFARDVLKKEAIDYSDFNLQFPILYQNWAYSSPRRWSRNYLSKSLQILKMLLNDAFEQGQMSSTIFKSKRYSLSQVEVDDIALNIDEIKALLKPNFSSKKMDIVRDTFVFACMTGLRYCDLSSIYEGSFGSITNKDGQGINVLTKITLKTGEKVVIPLQKIAEDILKKYNGVFPKIPCNQVFNRYIKKVCEVAGIKDEIVLRLNIAGKFEHENIPKYEAVSSHTARRTFATVSYFHFKIPTAVIMKITGHRTEKEFFKYIKISREQAALEMATYF